jgi:hypothetical protein
MNTQRRKPSSSDLTDEQWTILDRGSAKTVFKKLNRFFRRLKKVFADQAFQGTLVDRVKRYNSLLPTSMRASRFAMAYRHPYA